MVRCGRWGAVAWLLWGQGLGVGAAATDLWLQRHMRKHGRQSHQLLFHNRFLCNIWHSSRPPSKGPLHFFAMLHFESIWLLSLWVWRHQQLRMNHGTAKLDKTWEGSQCLYFIMRHASNPIHFDKNFRSVDSCNGEMYREISFDVAFFGPVPRATKSKVQKSRGTRTGMSSSVRNSGPTAAKHTVAPVPSERNMTARQEPPVGCRDGLMQRWTGAASSTVSDASLSIATRRQELPGTKKLR